MASSYVLPLAASATAVAGLALLARRLALPAEHVFVDAAALSAAALPAPRDTLFSLLQPHLVPMDELRKRGPPWAKGLTYAPLLELVQVLIGVQPTCDMLLEIWPPAFAVYNITVPNLLNLPESLIGLGTKPQHLVPLAMYTSSRAAGCAYCSAHTCSYAMRRGGKQGPLEAAVSGNIAAMEKAGMSPAEIATARVGLALGQLPAALTAADVAALKAALSPADAAWVVSGAAMFGSFNKLMDGLGVPLEPTTVAETRATLGASWSLGGAGPMIADNAARAPPPPEDNIFTVLRTLWLGLRPGGAAAVDSALLSIVPTDPKACRAHLLRRTGADLALLDRLPHARVVRAVTAIADVNLDDAISAGLLRSRKALAGLVFAAKASDARLAKVMSQIATAAGVPDSDIALASSGGTSHPDPLTAHTLLAASALATSPASFSAEIVDALRAGPMKPAMLVELVSFVAMCGMVHRFAAWAFFGEEEE
ncbi:hypothetical protein DFJ74DRAFT_768992 [Hyaloraphidium curvatum]|nr:hypothetical protein DFJ74DRAFT_768992 [Hyaloraphidium curvatum]